MKKEQKSFQKYYRFYISVVCVIGLLWNCFISACAAATIETEVLYVKMKDDNTYMVSRYDAEKRAGKEAAIYIRANANTDADDKMYPISEIAEDLCNNTGDMTTKNTDPYVFHYMDIIASEGLVIGDRAFRRNMVGAVLGDAVAPYVKIAGNTVARIGNQSFSGSRFYCSFTVDAPITLIDWQAFSEAQFYKKPVLFHGAIDTIGTQAFCGALFHNGLALDGGVGLIQSNAFQDATILADNRDTQSALYGTALQLKDVGEIQEDAFSGAKVHNGAIVLSGNIRKVGASAFEGVTFSYYTDNEGKANEEIPLGFVLSDSIAEIGESAFAATGVNMTSITMPENLESIGANAFQGWDSLTSVTLNSKLLTMETGALPDRAGMKIYLPDDIANVYNLNLQAYTNVVIVVNDTAKDLQCRLDKIGCTYEVRITGEEEKPSDDKEPYPPSSKDEDTSEDGQQPSQNGDTSGQQPSQNGDTSGQQSSQNGDTSGEQQNVSGDNGNGTQTTLLTKGDSFVVGNLKYKVLDSKKAAFTGVNSKKVKTLTIPEQVKIGSQTFKITEVQKKACYNNKSLTTVMVGDNVTTIRSAAFSGCTKLKNITLGTSVKSIGTKTFAKDKRVKKIIIKGKKLKSVGKNAFLDVPKAIEIRAPKVKVSAYTKMINRSGKCWWNSLLQ